jgi:FkbM family methyltransferase
MADQDGPECSVFGGERQAVVREIIQSVLGRFGYRLTRVENVFQPRYGLTYLFSLLKKLGFSPKHIIDVGANRGVWTRAALKFFPDARYTLVEPQDYLKAHIQDLLEGGSKIQWINAGASDKPGTLLFTISSRDDSSTFDMSEEQARAAGLQQTLIPVRTLNEIWASVGGPAPEMVKIDAEGFDLKVLSGASDLLGKTEIFLMEAVICGPCENTVREVTNRMHDAGYRLLDLTDLNRSPRHGVLWLCELAFVRADSHLLDEVTSYE